MQDTEHSGGQIEFAWSYHSVTNESIVLEIMLIGWAEMIGTKAIIAIKRSDGTWGMDTHTTSPRRPENACSPLPSKIAFVTNKSVANMNTMNARILVLPSDVYKLSWVCNWVWPSPGHPRTLRNVDRTWLMKTVAALDSTRIILDRWYPIYF